MSNKILHTLGVLILAGTALLLAISPSIGSPNNPNRARAEQEATTAEVSEGHDFATQVLRDAWDMSEYTDISQYMNQSGQADLLDNILVQNGVFSAKVSPLKQSSITMLFPGYKNALLGGKTGYDYPIDANKYKCLYVAAKVDSGPAQNGAPDQMVVYWFADENLNNGSWGQTVPGIVLYPEAYANQPAQRWKLYSQRLDQARIPAGRVPWASAPYGKWRGLRIDATLQQTTFQIDWVRLTDCQSVPVMISWPGSGTVSLSLMPENSSRDIQVLASTTQNPINFDAQGLQAGSYTYYVHSSNGSILTSGQFTVKPAPIVSFTRPSFTSGQDYASQSGTPWNFDDPADVVKVDCMSASVKNGVLSMDTNSTEAQPANCHGGNMDVPNPVAMLRAPIPVNGNEFRFLTFRLYTDGLWQNVPKGMIARWVWYVRGTSGLPANRCILVSYGIPYDVGWQTVTIDLKDPTEGLSEQTSVVECPPGKTWADTSPAVELGFKPNENIMGHPLHQELDWLRLSKMDSINRGQNFPIKVQMNVDWTEISDYSFFYTTDRNNPYQNQINPTRNAAYASLAVAPEQAYKTYMPIVTGLGNVDLGLNDLNTFLWNTSDVPVGIYYICMKATSYSNTVTYCSDAPLQVN